MKNGRISSKRVKLALFLVFWLLGLAMWTVATLTRAARDYGNTIVNLRVPFPLRLSSHRATPCPPFLSPSSSPRHPEWRIDNLDYGVPGKCDQIVERRGYSIGYVEKWEQPAWVTYRLTANEATNRVVSRSNDFREDPEIRSGSATPEDYRGSGYDRGHLAPAADMAWSRETMHDSFYMSNMSPQAPMLNRGVWADLEAAVRDFAVEEGSIMVVTGPVFGEADTNTIGNVNSVMVPGSYYKAVYDETPPVKAIGFLLPNEGSTNSFMAFSCPVSEVEKATGLRFFDGVSDEVKSVSEPEKWKWHPRDHRKHERNIRR